MSTYIVLFPLSNSNLKNAYFRNFYNWTMHFRNDADIVVSYGPDFVKKGQKPPYEFATTHKSPNQAGLSL